MFLVRKKKTKSLLKLLLLKTLFLILSSEPKLIIKYKELVDQMVT
jgi:hypothetical protein